MMVWTDLILDEKKKDIKCLEKLERLYSKAVPTQKCHLGIIVSLTEDIEEEEQKEQLNEN